MTGSEPQPAQPPSAALATTAPADSLARQLRLKRIFLRVLVVSLTACAAIAVGVLLFATFGTTTIRILSTLFALALHSGIAMACADSLERRRWPQLSRVGLGAFGVNFVVVIICIWWPGGPGDEFGRSILTTLTLIAAYIIAIPSASLQEQRRGGMLPPVGLAACVIAFLMVLICIWGPESGNEAFGRATGIAAVIAGSLAHAAALLRFQRGTQLDWLFQAALGAACATGAWACLMIGLKYEDDVNVRIMGALGVTDASATLALLIMARLRQVERTQKLESAEAQIQIDCPRCMLRQVVPAGPSRCSACGLKFKIEIEEPRCAKCGYLLWQLRERRCPECGTSF
jgi:hypothetical protein